MEPTIIVHGSARRIDESTHADHLAGTRHAARLGWETLRDGGSALDAVEMAVRTMEDDPTFDAGVGSVLNRAGHIEMDAIIMDGRTLALGAVAAVRGILNPIHLARILMEQTDHNFLVGEGARRFAEQMGMRLCAEAELTVEREIARFQHLQKLADYTLSDEFRPSSSPHPTGTVGAVAIDAEGHVAAATSTGGAAFKRPGRVGDSPLVGSGAYADDECGAASSTGHGESIMRVLLAKTATDAIRDGMSAPDAAQFAIDLMQRRVGGYGGIIVVDNNGRTGFAYNTPYMAVAWADEDGMVHARI